MSTPKQRRDQTLIKYGATLERKKIAPQIYIISSSFSDESDGLTVTHQHHISLRHSTLMTFQAVGITERYSLFISPAFSSKLAEIQAPYALLQREIINPLTEGQWFLDLSVLPMLLLRNALGETLPVKAGRRIWNTTLSQERVANTQWYNPRQPLSYTPDPPVVDNALIISELATQVGYGLQRNLDGDFSPDAAFTSEEVA